MQAITFLFAEYPSEVKASATSLCKREDLWLLDIRLELERQLRQQDELTTEIQSFIRSGQMLPDSTVEKLILSRAAGRPGNFLLMNYPRVVGQFLSLKQNLTEFRIPISAIWYFRFREDQATAIMQHMDDERKGKWMQDFVSRRNMICNMIEASACENVYTVDVDFPKALS